MSSESAYPLCWPPQQPRTAAKDRRERAPFTVGKQETVERWNGTERIKQQVRRSKSVPLEVAMERLEYELMVLGARQPVLSSNLELRLSGVPRARQDDPQDPGAAVWFTFRDKRLVLACDSWRRVADNIAAIAAHLAALRSIERYGVGTLEQAFTGYRAIEFYDWRRLLGVNGYADLATIEACYRALARRYHPDMPEGNAVMMAELNRAIQAARAELRPAGWVDTRRRFRDII